ncbi:MAG: universal stress protein [Chloroflexota bacterium]
MGDIPGELKTEVLEGPPAEAILNVADTRGNDLIVMGTRGRGRLSGLLLGSQSQKVVAHAHCPVLLIR